VDLNQLYSDHQVLLMRGARATSRGTRHEHEVGASLLAGQIGCMQRVLGAAAAPVWEALATIDNRSLSAPAALHQDYAL
jgi:hypothetical protein